jgi:DNA mismatch endonuclease, patch repair protein
MPDKFSSEVRSKIMSSIKSKGTKLETEVMKTLWKRGLRFTRNDNEFYGKPDIVIERQKTVIFIDSCFWHGCPQHYKRPKSNQQYWDEKYRRNTARDQDVNEVYEYNKWHIMRVWEHDLKEDYDGTIDRIMEFVRSAKEEEKQKKDKKS